MASIPSQISDPCAEFGPVQRWAVVWLISSIIVGALLCYKLASIDRQQYDSKGVYFDQEAHRKTRLAQSSIASERLDPRQKADYSSVQAGLN